MSTVPAQAAAKIAGVAKVLRRRWLLHLDHELAESVAPVATKLMEGYDALLVPATTTGKNIAPLRVAALLDVMQVSDILSVEGPGHVHAANLRRQCDRHGESRTTPKR